MIGLFVVFQFVLIVGLVVSVVMLERKVDRLQKKVARLQRSKGSSPSRKRKRPKGIIRKLERLF